MKATCKYVLTEDAQRAQMAATGEPVAREQKIDIDITADDLPYCDVMDDGTAIISTNRHDRALIASGWHNPGGVIRSPHYAPDVLSDIRRGEKLLADAYADACRIVSEYVIATPAQMMEHPERSYHVEIGAGVLPKSPLLDLHPRIDHSKWGSYGVYSTDLTPEAQDALRGHYRAWDEVRRAEQDAAIDAFLADPDARVSDSFVLYDYVALASCRIYSRHPRFADLHAEVKRRNQADAAAKEAARQALEDQKQAYIDAWIAEHADDDTQQQHQDGLLCRSAAVSLIADAAFAAAGVPEPAPELDTCDDSNCPCGSKTVECLPRRLYPAWREIRGRLPEGFTVDFERRRDCYGEVDYDSERAGPKYWVANITIPVGPFRFERTIRLG